jgi:hypothetical protein
MEVTKWLKPSISVSLIGDSASVAVHAAHTMAMFVLEMWEARKRGGRLIS